MRNSGFFKVMSARMRVGLSPITQDQFEMFGHIDTEDVVKQVCYLKGFYFSWNCSSSNILLIQIKEFLSMNSISQRQFGEHVLGLSQVGLLLFFFYYTVLSLSEPYDPDIYAR